MEHVTTYETVLQFRYIDTYNNIGNWMDTDNGIVPMPAPRNTASVEVRSVTREKAPPKPTFCDAEAPFEIDGDVLKCELRPHAEEVEHQHNRLETEHNHYPEYDCCHYITWK